MLIPAACNISIDDEGGQSPCEYGDRHCYDFINGNALCDNVINMLIYNCNSDIDPEAILIYLSIITLAHRR